MLKRVEGTGDAVLYRGDPRGSASSIDSWFQELLTEKRGAYARPHLYGADAGLCARRNVLLAKNEWMPSDKSAASSAYMAIGVALEEMLKDALEREGRLIAHQLELPLMPEVKVRGFADLLILDQEGEIALVEVKSCGKLPTSPSPVHLAQVQFYAAVSGFTKALITYISRNVRAEFGPELALRSFPVDTSEEVLRGRLRVAALSHLAIQEGRLTPVPAHFRKHTECHYCEFRDAFCWGYRPGLGGEEASNPLPELEPLELISLDAKAKKLEDDMYSALDNRRREILRRLGKETTFLKLPSEVREILERERAYGS